MQYLCPRCGSYMKPQAITVYPCRTYYLCPKCEYKSKQKEEELYMTLPRDLRMEDGREI